jgi:tetratricopeptide (TPR) repeat protein
MNKLKRIIFIFAVIVIGVINILIYWNSHLYYRSEKIEDNEKKIKILERANQIFPSNDLVFYELGKAYFDLGVGSLNDKALSEAYFRKSIESFARSIRINPASFFSHFNFAQSLLYMSYISPSPDFNSYDEHRKAALLAGHNRQVFYEVGKIFLSRWPELSEKDRDFTLEILRKIVGGKEREKLQTLMQIWDMNVKDYEIMVKILPEDAAVYRLYARFLGEKSLSPEVRQEMLARAEFLEFERAKSDYHSGENEFLHFRLKEAIKHFESCVNTLDRISFYQSLTHQALIDSSEFFELRKSALLNWTKCLLEDGRELGEVEGSLRRYLVMEDEVAAIGGLESYLQERGLIGEELGASFDDLDRISFQMLLSFRQNRYRDIMRVGRLLRESFVVVTETKKESYVKILQLVGDSYQKADYIYDALEFYQKALEMDSDNLETLLRIRRNYERSNDEEKIRILNERIEELLTPGERELKNPQINKGRSFSHAMNLDGKKIILDLHFGDGTERIEGAAPLISVFFNGRVVWDDYLKSKEEEVEEEPEKEGRGDVDKILSLSLKSKIGKNKLVVVPVNGPVNLLKITCRLEK